MHDYNHAKRRTIGMRPADVTSTTRLTVYDNRSKVAKPPRYSIGDVVRTSKYKSVFTKGYHANWSPELFKIVDIKKVTPVMYILQDMYNNRILGGFYEQEIQKTNHPDVYLIEKVLKKKGKKLYVKWLGHLKKSWIHEKDLR
ncbi:hypothetical protein ILUMI_01701 [Ignelater luminosus]|uniref:Chromo domain-containing protein n=1 Tax=Ignelater luminosus TaxID=2038154 RepID=A0A8K0DJH3_IGNLU|nr:hypothetical protein ILUMI_01701 [Ignelater luminosus]